MAEHLLLCDRDRYMIGPENKPMVLFHSLLQCPSFKWDGGDSISRVCIFLSVHPFLLLLRSSVPFASGLSFFLNQNFRRLGQPCFYGVRMQILSYSEQNRHIQSHPETLVKLNTSNRSNSWNSKTGKE